MHDILKLFPCGRGSRVLGGQGPHSCAHTFSFVWAVTHPLWQAPCCPPQSDACRCIAQLNGTASASPCCCASRGTVPGWCLCLPPLDCLHNTRKGRPTQVGGPTGQSVEWFATSRLTGIPVHPSPHLPAGFASIALDAVDAWVSSHLPPLAAAAAASGSPSKAGRGAAGAGGSGADGSALEGPPPVAVPRWVDTLLLALDILASTPPKPAPVAAPAGGAATSGAGGAAPMAGVQDAAGRAADEVQQPAAGDAPEAAPAPAAAEGAPNAGGGDAATNVTAAGQQQQAAAAVAGAAADRTASVTSPGEMPAPVAEGQPAGDAAQQEQQAAAQPELSAEERVWQALAAAVQQYSTGGSLSAQEQQRTVDLCLRLLRHLGR